jgi:putative hydrolase of the HAD superfamily
MSRKAMRIPPGIRAIFFDAVGTLIVPAPPAPQVYADVGQRYGSRLTLPAIAARFRAAFQRQEAKDLTLGLQTSEAREVERWRQIVGEVLDDTADPEACFRELFRHFSLPNAWRCDPEVGPLLEKLAGHGYHLGLASNYDARLRSVVSGLPELGPLRHLVISSEAGWRKPAPEFFAALCARAGVPAEQMLLIGDDWRNDYEGARQSGLQAVLLEKPGRVVRGTAVRIRQLSDLDIAGG